MLTIAETRRARLELLISQFGGVIADLNDALGYERTATQLTRIRNANVRSDRGKPFQMGDAQAREIEERLGLERGWMDTPPGYENLNNPTIRQLHQVASELAPYQITHLVKVASRLQRGTDTEPPPAQPPAPAPHTADALETRSQLHPRKTAPKVKPKRA